MYGVADVAVGAVDKKAGGLGLPSDKFQAIASNVLNNGNSRFGMKGSEELGGGLKANFNFEGGFSLATGATVGGSGQILGAPSGAVMGAESAAGTIPGTTLFSRTATVGLSGGFGSLDIGRQLTTSFFSVASWELTGTANYSVVANQFGFGGPGPRDNAAVRYSTPAMGGFNAGLMYVPEGDGIYGTAANPKGKYDLSVGYGAGPVVVSLATNKVDSGTEGTVLGGSYNFGVAKVALSYTTVKNGAGDKTTEGYSLGASMPNGRIHLHILTWHRTPFPALLAARTPTSCWKPSTLCPSAHSCTALYVVGRQGQDQGRRKRLLFGSAPQLLI
jgi:predicted porin